MSDPAEAADEMLNAEANEPTEPMLNAEPTDPSSAPTLATRSTAAGRRTTTTTSRTPVEAFRSELGRYRS